MDYRRTDFKDKSCKNEDYMETVRGMCWDLHDKGISYQRMADECGVCGSTVRNFANCLRDRMKTDNWKKFSDYIETMHQKIFG